MSAWDTWAEIFDELVDWFIASVVDIFRFLR